MNEIPTTTQLADLGCYIDQDGVTAHEAAIAELVSAARFTTAPSEMLDLMADPTQPPVVRQRAFARISRDWGTYRRELCLDQLLVAWRQHDDARLQGAGFSERMNARRHLDAVRLGSVPCE